jgi:hypothetical protein
MTFYPIPKDTKQIQECKIPFMISPMLEWLIVSQLIIDVKHRVDAD